MFGLLSSTHRFAQYQFKFPASVLAQAVVLQFQAATTEFQFAAFARLGFLLQHLLSFLGAVTLNRKATLAR